MNGMVRPAPEATNKEVLEFVRRSPGYFLTNNERDVSQSDFNGRIMPQTTLRVAPYRDETGYFAFEISGGASIHVDLMRKQINPFEKLRLVRKAMPLTLLQSVCRGRNLFGYRPYPDNVIRMTVRLFSRYIDVWRIYDFLNHVPNLKVVGEEVKKAGKILMPCICFSTGTGHTDDFYVRKVDEIIRAMGEDIILGIKNHSAVGSPQRIASLVRSIRDRFPDLLLEYHGHNTDGNDLGRMVSAAVEGVKIIEVSDHGFGGIYSQAPALSFIQILHDYGMQSPGLKIQPLVDTSDVLRR
jgi:pyruvate carboxylase